MRGEAFFEEIRHVLKISRSEPATFMELITCIHEIEQEGISASYKKVIKRLWPDEWQAAEDKIAFETGKWDLLRKRRRKINHRLLESSLCLSFYIQLTPEKAFRIIRGQGEIRRLRIEELERSLQMSRSDADKEHIQRAIDRLKQDAMPQAEGSRSPRRRWLYAGGFVLVLASLVFFLIYPRQPFTSPLPVDLSADVQRITIAVLPFDYAGEDPDMAYLAEGISKEMIAAFSRFANLWVTGRSSSRAYGVGSVDVKSVSAALGVQYVLAGAIRIEGERIRVSIQISDAAPNKLFWTGSWDRQLTEFFDLRKDLTLEVLTALQVKIGNEEKARMFARGTRNFEAYAKLMKIDARFFLETELSGVLLARQFSKDAIALDPGYAAAYAILADTYLEEFKRRGDRSLLDQALHAVQKALFLDGEDPVVRNIFSRVCWFRGDMKRALEEAAMAASVSPNYDKFIIWHGLLLASTGQFEAASELLERAVQLVPSEVPPLMSLGSIYQEQGEYDRAIVCFEKAFQLQPNQYSCSVHLTACYTALGRTVEANKAAKRVMELAPDFKVEGFLATRAKSMRAPINLKIFSEQLYLAGLS